MLACAAGGGHAQVDFGETLGVIDGVKCKLHYFAMALPHSDAFFIKAYPAETAEAFCDGHVSAVAFFGFDELNLWLEAQCLRRQDDTVRGHTELIGERLMRDLDALMALPPTPYDACEKVSTPLPGRGRVYMPEKRATSISMVRYRNNDYSVPVAYAHPLPGKACVHAREE